MNIVHLISGGDSGGAKTHIFSILRHLSRTDNVLLICFRDGAFAQEAAEIGIPTRVIDHRSLNQSMRELRQCIREGDFDIVHCHGSRGNMMGALLRRSFRGPVISTVHSDYKLDYLGRPFGRLTYGVINARALRRMDSLIGVSDAMVDTLIRRRFSPARLYSIYNGLDFQPPVSHPDRQALRRSFGLDVPPDAVVAGLAGRLDPVKDVPTLLRAMHNIADHCPNLYLLIAGDGKQRQELEQLAASLHIADRVCFAGWVTDMDAFYDAVDINVLTSLSETFPYVLTEGARYSLPTISSQVGGVPYLIDDGVHGLLFPAGDDKLLGAHLSRMAADPALRELLGRQLHDRAVRDFSLESTCRRQREIYETVLRRRDRAQNRDRDGAVICGAYGRRNAGDDAILAAILAEMQALDPDMPLCVMSRRPRETQYLYRVPAVYTFFSPAWSRQMRRSVLYINGGGSLMQNVTSRRSLWFYLHTLRRAHRVGCRIQMFGCGIGPIQQKADRRRTAKTLNRCVDVITLRDPHSMQDLASMGVTVPEITLAADPTVTLPAAPRQTVDGMFRRWGLDPEGSYIGLSMRRWPGFEAKAPVIAAAADYAWETYGLFPVFLPLERAVDDPAAHTVASYMKAPCHIVDRIGTFERTIGALSRMKIVLSMRLHALVFSAAQGVPVIGIVYDPKVSSFLDTIGEPLYEKLDALSLEGLKADIDAAYRRSGDPEFCQSALERLRTLEQENSSAARRLLGL
ncbi:MAG: polysaccharide pyruvyl transferase CsaB [Oscillospiraceae bacterium]|nr:polysaccharide pyruvyl transferase CsaB [Oscillospiraceae bacterium]